MDDDDAIRARALSQSLRSRVSGAFVPNPDADAPLQTPILGVRADASPAKPPPKEDKTNRRKQIDDAIDKAENG